MEVRNYHHFARGYLASRGKMANNAIASPDLAAGLGQQAVDGVKKVGWSAAAFDRPIQFLVEEFQWISLGASASLVPEPVAYPTRGCGAPRRTAALRCGRDAASWTGVFTLGGWRGLARTSISS